MADMDTWPGFMRGMGIGGWLTNYKRFNVLPDDWKMRLSPGDYEHFDSYITERDVAYIASLGLDHIRVGFDQIVMEEAPSVPRERTFRLLDNFLQWCKKYHLNAVLNMHKAVGNYCDIASPVKLLEDAALRERFTAFWVMCEKRWHDDPAPVFELLNEVTNEPAELWNFLAEQTVAAIRALNPVRKIIVGGVCWNSCASLNQLKLYDDPNIIYTYHFYTPYEFTHQRGVLSAANLYYNREMPYPGSIARYREFREFLGREAGDYGTMERMNIDFLHSAMRGAFDFIEAHPEKILWLGEFGTIRHCPLEYRENWMNDVIFLAREHRIPYCAWNYLSTPNDGNRFSLVDDDTRKLLSPRLARILRGEVELPKR